MNLLDQTACYLLRPRVLHRLPGRLRIHVPMLRRLPGQGGDVAGFVAELLCVPEGIIEVTPCLATGNILIRYDAGRHAEADVLGYLQSVTRLFIANRDRLEAMTPEGLVERGERLRGWLKDNLVYRLEVDGAMRIPDDVLA